MKSKKLFYFFLCFLGLSIYTYGQVLEPRREMRATWLTTVANLDWPKPSARGNAAVQKESLIAILDSMKALNINAIFFQVRTECDAFYESSYEPWSRYLGGSPGTYPGYDPLAFAIEEAHKRGLELHAWMNPYRINAGSDFNGYYASSHPFIENPEWALTYSDGDKILDPGLPVVQEYIKKVVGDLVSKYDVDGVHFDDYFYSYGTTPLALDQATYDANKDFEGQNRGDFRRASINKMVAQVWDTIQSLRPFVRFGISPFGIYGNNQNPEGIVGLDAYNTIYCDPLAWLNEGTVDYINPQLYWPTGGQQDFLKLHNWWSDQVNIYGRHVYAGHGIYRLSSSAPESRIDNTARIEDDLHENKAYINRGFEQARIESDGWTLSQVTSQINITRNNAAKGGLGSVFFRTSDFERVNGLKDHLLENVYQSKAVVPPMTWKISSTPSAPTNLRMEKVANEPTFSIKWDHPKDSLRYLVYLVNEDQVSNELNYKKLYDISYSKEVRINEIFTETFGIAVSTLDRYGSESIISNVFYPPVPAQVNLLRPTDNNTEVRSNDTLFWAVSSNSGNYKLEIATNTEFSENLMTISSVDTMYTIKNLGIEGDSEYFWKVTGVNFNGEGPSSPVFQFTAAFPGNPSITNPSNGSVDVSLETSISFNTSGQAAEQQLQMSKGGTSFSENSIVIDEVTTNSSVFNLSESLDEFTNYYVRIRSSNAFGNSKWSEPTQFRTRKLPPTKVVIAEPANGTVFPFPTTLINLRWNASNGATSYLLEVSDENTFSNPIVAKEVFSVTQEPISGLLPGATYYIRVAGKNISGPGAWSETTTVIMEAEPLSIGTDRQNLFQVYPNPFNSSFNIKSDEQIFTLEMFDHVGRFLLREKTASGNLLVENPDQVCAPCFIKISTENKTVWRKIISK